VSSAEIADTERSDLVATRRVTVLGAGVAGVSSFPTYVSSAEIEATEGLDLGAIRRVPVLGAGVAGSAEIETTEGPDLVAISRVPVFGAGVAARPKNVQLYGYVDDVDASSTCIVCEKGEGTVISQLEADEECESPHDSELFPLTVAMTKSLRPVPLALSVKEL